MRLRHTVIAAVGLVLTASLGFTLTNRSSGEEPKVQQTAVIPIPAPSVARPETPTPVPECALNVDFSSFRVPENLDVVAADIEALNSEIRDDTLRGRLVAFERFTCDPARSINQRAMALDSYIEVAAMITALDTNTNMPGTWRSRVTGSQGTVRVISTTDDGSRTCRLVDVPTVSVFIGDPEAMYIKSGLFCTPSGAYNWALEGEVVVTRVPITNNNDQGSPEVEPTPQNEAPSRVASAEDVKGSPTSLAGLFSSSVRARA